MPYPNEHSCRLQDPGQYKRFARQNCKIKHENKCIDFIFGIKGVNESELQAMRYPKNVWDANDARSHCKSKDGSFEAASEGDSFAGQMERRYTAEAEFRIEDGDAPIITGYAAVFDKWSEDLGLFREKIKKGAFTKTIKEHDIRALINHDPNLIIGRTKNKTLKLWEDDEGLGFEVKLPETSYAADLAESIRRKDITQNSFGFQAVQDEWTADQKKRTLLEVRLFDVSPVTFPAYKQTTVAMRLHDMGIDYEALNMALIRADQGIVTNSDVDLFNSTIGILNRYVPIEPEPAAVAPTEAPSHSETPGEPDLSTLMKARLARMAISKLLRSRQNE